jgi:hypothetical protein
MAASQLVWSCNCFVGYPSGGTRTGLIWQSCRR